MHLSTQEVLVDNLQIGMFISRLDVPWVQTPFAIQGFILTEKQQIDQLAHYCSKVYVDRFLSKVSVRSELSLKSPIFNNKSILNAKTKRMIREKARFKPSVESYIISTKLKKEVHAAGEIYDTINQRMSVIIQDIIETGCVNKAEIRSVSNDMVKSIIRNPDALAWICRINHSNNALHEQSARSAIWALIFARHLGLARQDLIDLCTALLLAPIGKSKLSQELLTDQLTAEETDLYQEHIHLTLEETKKMFSSSHQVNYILSSYCERNNGSGYPRNQVGNRIPFLSRVAGLALHYEELINPLSQNNTLTPVEAISTLYNERGSLFQHELIESFIQAIGIYPTGSLVQLTDRSIGVVMEQQLENSRLRPKVAIVKNNADIKMLKPKFIELSESPVDDHGMPLQIEKSLNSTSLDIGSQELHDKLFNTHWFSFLKAS